MKFLIEKLFPLPILILLELEYSPLKMVPCTGKKLSLLENRTSAVALCRIRVLNYLWISPFPILIPLEPEYSYLKTILCIGWKFSLLGNRTRAFTSYRTRVLKLFMKFLILKLFPLLILIPLESEYSPLKKISRKIWFENRASAVRLKETKSSTAHPRMQIFSSIRRDEVNILKQWQSNKILVRLRNLVH